MALCHQDDKNTATSYTIAEGINEIASGAFYGNEYLKYITIGKDVVTIGDGAFIACTSLLSIYVADGNEAFVSTAKYGDGAVGVLYEVKSRKPDSTVQTAALVAYPAGARATYVTVGGAFDVDEVKSSAFDSAKYLTLVYFESYVSYGGEEDIFDNFVNRDSLKVCLPLGAAAESFATYLNGEGIEVLRYTSKDAFTFARNTSGYTVTGIVANAEEGYFINGEKQIVKVPLYYNGLPVTEIADYAFAVKHTDDRGGKSVCNLI